MTITSEALDDLDYRLGMLDSVLEYLRGAEPDTQGLMYVLAKLADDIDAIIDPAKTSSLRSGRW